MNYTLSDSFSTDAGTGHRLHDDDKAIPTAVSSEDMNMLIWSLMEVINAAGVAPAQFDSAVPATYSKVLMALRSAGLFQTAAQFDNTTKAATTEFAQKVGLKAAARYALTASGGIPASYAGSSLIVNSSASTTQALPAASSVPAGSRISLININTGVGTITRSGTDVLYVNAGFVTSLAMGVGDTLVLESNGTNGWDVNGGSSQLRYSSAFASSLTANGWKRYPDPNSPTGYFFEQWGVSGSIPQGGSLAITFPIGFPNACTGVYPTTYGQTTGTTLPFSVGSASYSPSSAVLWNNGANGPIVAVWCAKGY